MKKKLLSIICFLACVISVHAQTLFGLTPDGGNDGAGSLIKFIPATNNLTRWFKTFNMPVIGPGIYFLERNTETGKKILEKIVYLLAEMQPTNLKAT
jgi:hypothetical protein